MSNELSLSDLASRMGYREVPEVLAAAETPIGRGHHLALAVGRGAGADAVYARAVAATCTAEGPTRALILVPTRERALEVALAVQRALAPLGIRSSVPALRTDGSLDASSSDATCMVERPSLLLPEVRLGRLPLGDLKLLVVDGVADLEDLDEWASAEPIIDTLSDEARRVVTSRRVDGPFKELLQRHLPRGRRWPEEAFDGSGEKDSRAGGLPEPLYAAQSASERERLGLLLHAIRDFTGPTSVSVRCRSETSLPGVAAALESAGLELTEAMHGWDVTGVPGSTPDTSDGVDETAASAAGHARVWFGLPLSAGALETEGENLRRVAIVDPVHGPQLELLAERAGLELRALPGLAPTVDLDPLWRYRSRVRARIEKGSTDAELLVLEPLFAEFGTVRVAAAVSDILRRSGATEAGGRAWADVEAASLDAERASATGGASHRGVRGAWSKIFVGAGSRDSVRAGDLVGAITGETGIAGAQIGKIEIRGSFSLIEIDSQVVDQVIQKMDGTAIRGRAVMVKPDREG
jgi:ATP-dependent RNA helicase DeaD